MQGIVIFDHLRWSASGVGLASSSSLRAFARESGGLVKVARVPGSEDATEAHCCLLTRGLHRAAAPIRRLLDPG